MTTRVDCKNCLYNSHTLYIVLYDVFLTVRLEQKCTNCSHQKNTNRQTAF